MIYGYHFADTLKVDTNLKGIKRNKGTGYCCIFYLSLETMWINWLIEQIIPELIFYLEGVSCKMPHVGSIITQVIKAMILPIRAGGEVDQVNTSSNTRWSILWAAMDVPKNLRKTQIENTSPEFRAWGCVSLKTHPNRKVKLSKKCAHPHVFRHTVNTLC